MRSAGGRYFPLEHAHGHQARKSVSFSVGRDVHDIVMCTAQSENSSLPAQSADCAGSSQQSENLRNLSSPKYMYIKGEVHRFFEYGPEERQFDIGSNGISLASIR